MSESKVSPVPLLDDIKAIWKEATAALYAGSALIQGASRELQLAKAKEMKEFTTSFYQKMVALNLAMRTKEKLQKPNQEDLVESHSTKQVNHMDLTLREGRGHSRKRKKPVYEPPRKRGKGSAPKIPKGHVTYRLKVSKATSEGPPPIPSSSSSPTSSLQQRRSPEGSQNED